MKEKKPVIMIVDDVATNVQALASILKDDYTLKVATNGQTALKLSVQEPIPDLILLDVQMPGMSGFDVCKILKSKDSTKGIPVIFVTGNVSDGSEELGLSLGAVDYITKPIKEAIVKVRVKTHIDLKLMSDNLFSLAMNDALTSVYNRHFLFNEAERILSRSRRNNEIFSVVMLDIDKFKLINDEHGHQVGDDVLKAIANEIKVSIRNEDVVARYGGEEFVVILTDCDVRLAKEKAEYLRVAIEKLKPNGLKVTSSFGISVLNSKYIDFDEMLKDADDALYEAKESGRNRVVFKNRFL